MCGPTSVSKFVRMTRADGGRSRLKSELFMPHLQLAQGGYFEEGAYCRVPCFATTSLMDGPRWPRVQIPPWSRWSLVSSPKLPPFKQLFQTLFSRRFTSISVPIRTTTMSATATTTKTLVTSRQKRLAELKKALGPAEVGMLVFPCMPIPPQLTIF